jgi:membrane protein YdbS with pleckstrin-like domain
MTMLDPDSDRLRPTWRKPAGILALILALAIYAGLVAKLAEPIGRLPVLAQTLAYVVLGTIWLLPLRRFLIWMETGRWT